MLEKKILIQKQSNILYNFGEQNYYCVVSRWYAGLLLNYGMACILFVVLCIKLLLYLSEASWHGDLFTL